MTVQGGRSNGITMGVNAPRVVNRWEARWSAVRSSAVVPGVTAGGYTSLVVVTGAPWYVRLWRLVIFLPRYLLTGVAALAALMTFNGCGGYELPDWFGCDDLDEVVTTDRGDSYGLDRCWDEAGLHCCRYVGVGFDCSQTVCAADCRHYRSRGVECVDDQAPTPPLHLGGGDP